MARYYYLYVTVIPSCITSDEIKGILSCKTQTYGSYNEYSRVNWDQVAEAINERMSPEETYAVNPSTGGYLFSKQEALEYVKARENRKFSDLPLCFEHEDGSICSYVLKRKEAE